VGARVLTQEEVDEMTGVAGLGSLIVYIDGQPYNREDLHGCDDCDYLAPTNDGLDDMNRCQHCAELAVESQRELDDHRSWYRAVAR
jgi:hypothetical protein